MSSVQLGATVVDTLHAMGAWLVVAPGSRNAPLSMRADYLARIHGADLYVAIDERSAAFTALGLAKSTGRPAAVMVTSGSAVANTAPALLEAKYAGIPLIVVSADRPSEQVGTGASQTAEQIGIFGPSVLGITRLSSESGGPAAWSAAVQRAVHLSLGTRTREPGPVQINTEFTPPLVGDVPDYAPRIAQIAPSYPSSAAQVRGQKNTVIVAGDMSPSEGVKVRAIAEHVGVPLFAEPSSNARNGSTAIATYRRLLSTELGAEIQRVILFGHPTLSRPQTALLSRDDVELIVVSNGATWHDVGHTASMVVDDIAMERQDPAWLRRWQEADQPVTPSWGGGLVASAVLESLHPNDALVLGASMIIREADLLSPFTQAHVYSSRGQSGIDGTIATARGIALGTGRPTTVLLGDVTAQHDLGSLVRPPLEPQAHLRVVVGDDNGGAIFHKLEQGAPRYADSFERVFGTPQNANLVGVAEALGWRVAAAHNVDELRAALASDAEFIVARYRRTYGR